MKKEQEVNGVYKECAEPHDKKSGKTSWPKLGGWHVLVYTMSVDKA
jgi:hypothetical protein